MADEKAALVYLGHPLRRKGNLIYYGSMGDKYIVMLQIMSTKKMFDLEMADKVSVQLQLTDPNLKSRARVIRTSEKSDLFSAIDLGATWLTRALSGKSPA